MASSPRRCSSSSATAAMHSCPTSSSTFASKTLAQWRDALETMSGAWAPVQRAPELKADGQVVANGYLQHVVDAEGRTYDLVGAPAQFDGQPHELRAAPEHGARGRPPGRSTGSP